MTFSIAITWAFVCLTALVLSVLLVALAWSLVRRVRLLAARRRLERERARREEAPRPNPSKGKDK